MALYQACLKGRLSDVQAILDGGQVDVNMAADTGTTCLMVACQHGHAQVGNELISRGAEINRADKYGRTALMLAAFYGKESCVKLLLDAKVDKMAKNEDGQTALHVAIARGNASCVELLAPTKHSEEPRTAGRKSQANGHPRSSNKSLQWETESQSSVGAKSEISGIVTDLETQLQQSRKEIAHLQSLLQSDLRSEGTTAMEEGMTETDCQSVGDVSEHNRLLIENEEDVTSMLANARREAAYFRGRAERLEQRLKLAQNYISTNDNVQVRSYEMKAFGGKPADRSERNGLESIPSPGPQQPQNNNIIQRMLCCKSKRKPSSAPMIG
jgi:hypothetical protein